MFLSGDQIAPLLVAVCFAAGLNVYATVATLGLLGRFGWVALPDQLSLLTDHWIIGTASALFLLEFVVDKIPFVDLVWNALQTFVRVPIGGYLAYAAAAHLSPPLQLAASVAGGAIALASHSAKTAARAVVTPSPEPFSNFALSSAEDAFAIGLTWFATRHPWLAAAIATALIVVIVVLMRWVIRGVSMFVRSLGSARRRGDRSLG